jgi:hypothetical protein
MGPASLLAHSLALGLTDLISWCKIKKSNFFHSRTYHLSGERIYGESYGDRLTVTCKAHHDVIHRAPQVHRFYDNI